MAGESERRRARTQRLANLHNAKGVVGLPEPRAL